QARGGHAPAPDCRRPEAGDARTGSAAADARRRRNQRRDRPQRSRGRPASLRARPVEQPRRRDGREQSADRRKPPHRGARRFSGRAAESSRYAWHPGSPQGRPLKKWLLAALIVSLLGGSAFWRRASVDPSLVAEVRRGPLTAQLTTSGILKPIQSITYRSPLA